MAFAYRWHEGVILQIDDGQTATSSQISPIALEALLTCSLSVFASLDGATRQNLVKGVANRPILALLTNLSQNDDLLRIEMLRELNAAAQPSALLYCG